MTPSCLNLLEKSIFSCQGALLKPCATQQQDMLLHSTLTQPLIKGRYCVIEADSSSTGMQNNITEKFLGLPSHCSELIVKGPRRSASKWCKGNQIYPAEK